MTSRPPCNSTRLLPAPPPPTHTHIIYTPTPPLHSPNIPLDVVSGAEHGGAR